MFCVNLLPLKIFNKLFDARGFSGLVMCADRQSMEIKASCARDDIS